MNRYLSEVSKIAIPISIQSLITSSLNMVDQMMIGKLGESSMVAVGIGNRFFIVLFFMLIGLSSGAGVYVAQYFGKKEYTKIAQVLGVALSIGIIIAIGFFIASLTYTESILGIFTKDKEVIKLAIPYVKLIAYTFFPLTFTMIYSAILRSTGHVKLQMFVSFFVVLLNTFLNYTFIFGNFGFEARGIEGAANATVISRIVEIILILAFIYYRKYTGAFHIREIFKWDISFMKMFFITTTPLILTELLWVLGDTAFSVIYSQMGTSSMAAITISFPVQMLSIGIFTGLGAASGVLLGNKLGAEEPEIALDDAKRFIITGGSLAAVLGVAIIFLSKLYVSNYNISKTVSDSAIRVIIIFSIFLFAKVINMIIAGGILRSGGDTKYTLFLDISGMWFIGFPLGLLTAFYFKLPIYYVYIFISLEEIYRLILGVRRTYSGKWRNNLVKNI